MADLVVTCPACSLQAHFSDVIPFRAECEKCAADLHVCIACTFYDRYVENECREPTADPVGVKDRRNLCEYFKPRTEEGVDGDKAAALAKLNAAFGIKGASPTDAAAPRSAADEAKAKLEALFKKK